MNATTLSFDRMNVDPKEFSSDESLFSDIDYPANEIANENQQPQDLDEKEDRCPKQYAALHFNDTLSVAPTSVNEERNLKGQNNNYSLPSAPQY